MNRITHYKMKPHEVKKLIKSIEEAARGFEMDMAKVEGQVYTEYSEEPKLRKDRYEQLLKEKAMNVSMQVEGLLNMLNGNLD